MRSFHRWGAGLSVVVAVVLAGCSDDGGRTGAGDRSPPTAPSDPTSAPTSTTAGGDPTGDEPPTVDDLSGAAAVLAPVAELDQPIALATRAGSTALYVAERAGRVVVVDPSGEVGTAVVDISADTTTDSERGLLGLAFDPDGEHLYLSFTDPRGDTRLDRWRLDGEGADPASRRTVFTQSQPFSNHNGGHVAFGPDGLLYLALGDGGGGGDPLGAGQDPQTLLGKIIRIDPAPDGDRPYAIPGDNPHATGGGLPEVFISGVRNPWRFSWDSATADLWIADVGQNAVEEVNLLPAPDDRSSADRGAADRGAAGRGANLGWSIFEGDERFGPGEVPDRYVGPVHTYRHGPGCSIIGGFVSRDPRIPGLFGAYLYSDHCDPTVHALLARDGTVVDARSLGVEVPGGSVVSFGEGPDGELYVMSLAGGLYRIDPA